MLTWAREAPVFLCHLRDAVGNPERAPAAPYSPSVRAWSGPLERAVDP